MTLPSDHPWNAANTAESRLVRAMQARAVDRPPVWFMRQAGRSLPEYRKAREGIAMLDACLTPDLAAEITCQPVRRHGVDAAIFFSDIVVPIKCAGVDVEIKPGVGPVVAQPVRTAADLERVPPASAGMFDAVAAGVRATVAQLGATPLIGFAGAPFTVASYLIEGGPSRDLPRTKAMMLRDPQTFAALLARLADLAAEFLRTQILAGASAIQLFDSWAGNIPARLYRAHVLPHSRRVFESVADLGVPSIHFAVGANHLARDMASAGNDVQGVDFRIDLEEVDPQLRHDLPLQGNLDPAVLLSDRQTVEAEVRRVLAGGRGLPGHVFNLGHGVLPDTDPDLITFAVEAVDRYGQPFVGRSAL
ncbi:MAG: uroporphyrinogen decarboxylase [Candidatus Nanopelagicales bacterium]